MMPSHRSIFVCLVVATLALCHPSPSSASSGYNELVTLFNEFREYQEPPISEGLPDFSAAAVNERFKGLKSYQQRLAALEIDDWPIWQQADYHLVRAEMNAVEFHYRVFKPWARDPGFYSLWSGDAGPSVNLFRYVAPLFEGELPLSREDHILFLEILREIPVLYEKARGNLTIASGDLADLALYFNREDAEIFDQIAERLQDHHPDLADGARHASQASRGYLEWLQKHKHTMTAPAGLGKDNYSWWLKNVQLMPWGWEEVHAIVQREYDRVITFLKLEEHRNRDLPPLEVATTYEEWDKRLRQALHYVVDFLREEEIMTIPEWVDPSDYYDWGDGDEGGAESDRGDFLLPEKLTVDTRYRQRELLPGETHEYVGHMLDHQRQERLTKSRIRSAERLYNMYSIRTEGWAVALEELLMQAGVLDERPRRGRIMEYLMNASHMSLAIPDLKMHANEITLAEGRRLCAEIMPRGWSDEDDPMVWFEMKSNIANPGGFHSNVVLGKAYFMKLFRERAQELGEDFVIRDFVDEFLASGLIPMSLIRWEMTGNSDDITLVTEDL
jgi:hypothetical protein